MANPSGVTMPSFELVESSQYVFRKGASDVFGQVNSIDFTSTSNTTDVFRIGDTSGSTSYKPVTHSGTIVIYTEEDFDEVGALLGATRPSGGWSGATNIRLNNTIAAEDYFMDIYDGATGTGDTKKATITFDNLKPSSVQMQVGADSNVQLTLQFKCDDIYLTPVSGA
jgi:hypothetical protein